MRGASINPLGTQFPIYHTHTDQCISFLTKGPHFLALNTRNTHHIYCAVSVPASTTILKQLRRQPGHWCKAKGITPSNTSNASAAVTAANQKLSGGQSPQIYSPGTWGWSTAWPQLLVTALHMDEAMQKGQTLWCTDTNQDLPSCTLIYTAVSEVVGKLAASGKEEAWGHHLTPTFVLQASAKPRHSCWNTDQELCTRVPILLHQVLHSASWGSCCMPKSATIMNLLHISKCPWRGTITHVMIQLPAAPNLFLRKDAVRRPHVWYKWSQGGTLPVEQAGDRRLSCRPSQPQRFIDSPPPQVSHI